MRLAAACLGAALALAAAAAASQVPAAKPAASATGPARGEEGTRWHELAPAQREALAPLEREWPSIDAQRKQKWLALAARFRSLGPDERARITARMSEWARLTPAERGQARLRFEEARQLPAPDRNARWQAYQALPPDARQKLVARAASAAASGTAETRRDAGRPARIAREANGGREAKVNLVPSTTPTQAPRQVAPTLVQAGPGATTTLITRRPAPPTHQQTGMPKIAATPEFVNRSTLLPKRGPQAAAVASAASAATPAGQSPPIIAPAPKSVLAPASAPLK